MKKLLLPLVCVVVLLCVSATVLNTGISVQNYGEEPAFQASNANQKANWLVFYSNSVPVFAIPANGILPAQYGGTGNTSGGGSAPNAAVTNNAAAQIFSGPQNLTNVANIIAASTVSASNLALVNWFNWTNLSTRGATNGALVQADGNGGIKLSPYLTSTTIYGDWAATNSPGGHDFWLTNAPVGVAFRLTGDFSMDVTIGGTITNNSFGFGSFVTAGSANGTDIGLGNNCVAIGGNSIAMGLTASARSPQSIAMGNTATVSSTATNSVFLNGTGVSVALTKQNSAEIAGETVFLDNTKVPVQVMGSNGLSAMQVILPSITNASAPKYWGQTNTGDFWESNNAALSGVPVPYWTYYDANTNAYTFQISTNSGGGGGGGVTYHTGTMTISTNPAVLSSNNVVTLTVGNHVDNDWSVTVTLNANTIGPGALWTNNYAQPFPTNCYPTFSAASAFGAASVANLYLGSFTSSNFVVYAGTQFFATQGFTLVFHGPMP